MSGTVTAAGAAAGATASGIGTPKLSADLGTFLTLLTTQLRNQDPTKPMDTETLTQQLVQFATVEQQLAGNKTLEQLLSLQQAGQLANTAPLIGSRVTVETDALPLQGGSAVVVLPAAGQARSATIQVLDAAGTTIRSTTVTLGAQPTYWAWDGTDTGGTARPDGTYQVVVNARTADGTATPVSTAVNARVTGATRIDGHLMLRLGSAMVGFDKLRELPGG
jgi:flagellar basal-body rod modification protein FlgD